MSFLSKLFDKVYLWIILALFFLFGILDGLLDSVLTLVISDRHFPDRRKKSAEVLKKVLLDIVAIVIGGAVGFFFAFLFAKSNLVVDV